MLLEEIMPAKECSHPKIKRDGSIFGKPFYRCVVCNKEVSKPKK